MKRILALIAVTIGWLLLGFSVVGKDKPAREEKAARYDIAGKRVGPAEKYLVEWPQKDGRVIIYRNNKRDIDALIKALKASGVTDPNFLNAATWTNIACSVSGGSCVSDPSCKTPCVKYFVQAPGRPTPRTERHAPNVPFYCTCKG
jgi:hypothetical protein